MQQGNSVEINNLCYQYDKANLVIDEMNLSVRVGEIYSIVGPSGIGKTTLLKLILGELLPTKGSIDFSIANPKIVLLSQQLGIFPWKTVAENVALATRFEDNHCLVELLKVVGLEQYANRFPNSLSGGQQQRVAIAQALALSSNLLLLDEPFKSLDPATREELHDVLFTVIKKRKMTAILITHDIEEAVYLSDRIGVMQHGGRIAAEIEVARCLDRSVLRSEHRYFNYQVEIRERLRQAV